METDVDVVLFDLDGTLVDHELAAKQAMTTLVALYPDVLGQRPVVWARATWHQLQETWFPRYLLGEVTFERHRIERVRALWEKAGAEPPTDQQALEAFSAYLAAYEDAWQVYPDTFPALDRLRGHHRLGIVTNGETDQQQRKLVRCGLAGRFEVMVTSKDVGTSKPDPRLFQAALDQLGVTADRCVYVGDRLETDPVAAAEMGMWGVWLDREDVGGDTGHDRVRRITTLLEL